MVTLHIPTIWPETVLMTYLCRHKRSLLVIHISSRIAETVVQSQPQLPYGYVWCWSLKKHSGLPLLWSKRRGRWFYICHVNVMLMKPNKAETAVHGCHSTGNKLWACVEVLAKPWRCVVWPLLSNGLLWHFSLSDRVNMCYKPKLHQNSSYLPFIHPSYLKC